MVAWEKAYHAVDLRHEEGDLGEAGAEEVFQARQDAWEKCISQHGFWRDFTSDVQNSLLPFSGSHLSLFYRITALNLPQILDKLLLIPFYHFLGDECEFMVKMWQSGVKHPATDRELRL